VVEEGLEDSLAWVWVTADQATRQQMSAAASLTKRVEIGVGLLNDPADTAEPEHVPCGGEDRKGTPVESHAM
jgi:hypothetical protein